MIGYLIGVLIGCIISKIIFFILDERTKKRIIREIKIERGIQP